MCTVIIRVAATPNEPTRLLAIRDEDPERPWDPLGEWWPDTHPGVVGVHDRRAGGAWLAANPDTRRLAVLLNRADRPDAPHEPLPSRGTLVLDSMNGTRVIDPPATHGFNLVEIEPGLARVTMWDGVDLRIESLVPGTHMIAHTDVDDMDTPRIARWLDAFRDEAETPDSRATGFDDAWWGGWVRLLEQTTSLSPTDDRAIIRDNRPLGYPTQSLLACVASVSSAGLEVRDDELLRPGTWNTLDLTAPRVH